MAVPFPPALARTALYFQGRLPLVWQYYFTKAIGSFPDSLARTPILNKAGQMPLVWQKYLESSGKPLPDALVRTPIQDREGNINHQWLKYLQSL